MAARLRGDHMLSSVRRSALFISAGLTLGLLAGLIASPAKAVTLQPMTVAYNGIVSGNFTTTGNTVLTCSTATGTYAASCVNARKRTATRLNNDDYVMTNVKVPFGNLADASYFNSSSGVIVIPAGARVVHASLFWGGSTRVNPGDGPAVDASAKGQVLFARPGDNCATTNCTITATPEDIFQINATTNLGPYRASADITGKLTDSAVTWTQSGPHQSLTVSVANIQTTTGRDKTAGWGVMVVYQDPQSSPHHIRILKGMAQESIVQDDAFIFDGFQTANTGNVLTEIGMVAFDGDASNKTDSISISDAKGSAIIADRANPDDNIANSTVAISGIISPYLNNVSIERSSNTFGVDVDRISLVNGLSNDVTAAQLIPSVSSDVFYVTGVALSNEITSPDIQLTKYVSSVTGADPNALETGDTVEYTITATNNGQANASNLVIRDDLGADLTLVSSTATDCASVPAGDVCKNLGALNAGATTSFTITGTVTGASQATTGQFDNYATATYDGLLGSHSAISEVITLKYGALTADLASSVSFIQGATTTDYIQAGKSTTITASITNLGPTSDPNPILELVAQDGAKLTVKNVPAGCTQTAATTLSCNAAALGISAANPLMPGAKASLSFTVTPKRTSTSFKVWATAKTGVMAGDPNVENDTSETMLYVNHKPKAKLAKATAKAGGDAIKIPLAKKISDIDGDALRIKLGKVKYGSATVTGDIVTFTPPKKWTGTFKIRYTVTDGKGGKANSFIVIKVKKSGSSGGFGGVKHCFNAGC
jgi:uncharacterized repeat protein (TIGR01451 family)